MRTEDLATTETTTPPSPVNKESPLTDIATSPPPFEFSSNNKDSGLEDNTYSNQNTPSASEGNSAAATNINHRKDSYESSELSDLGDDSEAETDKMDFLDDDGNSSSDKVSDLKALSKLTEMARLKEVESDDGIDEVKKEIKEESPKLSDDVRDNNESKVEGEENQDNILQPIDSDPAELQNADDLPVDPTDSESTNKKNEENVFDTKNEADQTIINGLAKRPADDQADVSHKKQKLDVESEIKHVQENSIKSEEIAHSNGDVNKGTETNNVNVPDVSPKDDHDEADEENEDDDKKTDEHDDDSDDDEDGEDSDLAKYNEMSNETEVDMNKQRKLAIDELISIESSFAQLRDKLYQDKLTLLEYELQLCLEGSHPELSKIYYKVNSFYQDSLKLANSNLSYKLKCIDTETIATRTSIHQNFLKKLMDCKNEMITNTTSLWYKINKERNQLDQLVPDYNFSAIPSIPNYTVEASAEDCNDTNGHIPTENSEYVPLTKKAIKQNTVIELVQNRNDINHQLGILNGLLQFHGFPSAIYTSLSDYEFLPSQGLLLRKATDEEINEDLMAMGIPI